MSCKLTESVVKEMKDNAKFTMKQMCEHIVKADILIPNSNGERLTAEEIFNSSPTGELYYIFTLFGMACEKIGLPNET